MATRIYTYGARPPTDGAEVARDQLYLAHRYYNALVEIERARRVRYREIERSIIPDEIAAAVVSAEADEGAAARAAIDARAGEGADQATTRALKTAHTAARQRLKEARAAYKEAAQPIRDATALLGEARTAEKVARKEAGKRDRDDAAIGEWLASSASEARTLALRIHTSDTVAAAATRRARGASGLPWGTYTLVEDDFQRAAKDTAGDPDAPRFARWTGEGRIGAPQFPGGLTPDEATEGGTRFRLEILPLPEDASRRMASRRHAIAHLRLGSTDDGDPVWARWPILYARPIPVGATIRRAWALCRMVAGRPRWDVQITIAEPEKSAPVVEAGRERIASIDVGWRATAGYRVGYVTSTEHAPYAVCAPPVSFARGKARREYRDRRGLPGGMAEAPADLVRAGWSLPISEATAYLDGIGSVRDRHLDVARAWVRAYLDTVPDVPAWLVEATAHLHQWRAPKKLVGLLRKWERAGEAAQPRRFPLRPGEREWLHADRRIPGDDAILDGLRAWAAKDAHLYQWEAHGTARILAARRQHYRTIAARIVAAHDVIVVPKIDLRTFAEGPAPTEAPASAGRALRVIQADCAPSEWIEAVKNAAKREGKILVELPTVNDSRTCHGCGAVETIGADLFHACTNCGRVWDRDVNATLNRIARAGYDAARAAKLCAASLDRSRGDSPTGGASGDGAGATVLAPEGRTARKVARKGAT